MRLSPWVIPDKLGHGGTVLRGTQISDPEKVQSDFHWVSYCGFYEIFLRSRTTSDHQLHILQW